MPARVFPDQIPCRKVGPLCARSRVPAPDSHKLPARHPPSAPGTVHNRTDDNLPSAAKFLRQRQGLFPMSALGHRRCAVRLRHRLRRLPLPATDTKAPPTRSVPSVPDKPPVSYFFRWSHSAGTAGTSRQAPHKAEFGPTAASLPHFLSLLYGVLLPQHPDGRAQHPDAKNRAGQPDQQQRRVQPGKCPGPNTSAMPSVAAVCTRAVRMGRQTPRRSSRPQSSGTAKYSA